LRSTGASQSCAVRRRGSARFTQTLPTFQISEDTPPLKASAGPVVEPRAAQQAHHRLRERGAQ
jgi:hypothetical protein